VFVTFVTFVTFVRFVRFVRFVKGKASHDRGCSPSGDLVVRLTFPCLFHKYRNFLSYNPNLFSVFLELFLISLCLLVFQE